MQLDLGYVMDDGHAQHHNYPNLGLRETQPQQYSNCTLGIDNTIEDGKLFPWLSCQNSQQASSSSEQNLQKCLDTFPNTEHERMFCSMAGSNSIQAPTNFNQDLDVDGLMRMFDPTSPLPFSASRPKTGPSNGLEGFNEQDYGHAPHQIPNYNQVTNDEGTEKDQEEFLLLQLKHEQNLAWKTIRERLNAEFGKDYTIPALQMRYRRLRRRRLLNFNEKDQLALCAAYEYWETKRWEIISEKMAELGTTEHWTPKACATAWRKLQSIESNHRSSTSQNQNDVDFFHTLN